MLQVAILFTDGKTHGEDGGPFTAVMMRKYGINIFAVGKLWRNKCLSVNNKHHLNDL